MHARRSTQQYLQQLAQPDAWRCMHQLSVCSWLCRGCVPAVRSRGHVGCIENQPSCCAAHPTASLLNTAAKRPARHICAARSKATAHPAQPKRPPLPAQCARQNMPERGTATLLLAEHTQLVPHPFRPSAAGSQSRLLTGNKSANSNVQKTAATQNAPLRTQITPNCLNIFTSDPHNAFRNQHSN